MACELLNTLDLGPLPCSANDPLFLDDSMDLGENFLQLLEGTDFALVEELPSLPPLSFAGLGAADLNPAVETPTSASEASSLLPAPSSGAYACASQPVVLQTAVARGPSTRRRGPTLPPPPVPPPAPTMQHEEAGLSSLFRTVTTAPAAVGTLGQQAPAHPTVHTSGSNTSSPANSSNPPASSSATPASTSKPAQQATSAHTRSPRRAAAASFVNTQRSKRHRASPVPDGGDDDDDDDDTDSEDSNDAEEDAMHVDGPSATAAKASSNKRKAPEIDWRSITDPAERRRQRRLAKNRVTAARSRERKKSQWADMEGKMKGLEQENAQLRAMLEAMSAEHQALKLQLDAIARGTLPVSSLGAASIKGGAAPHTSAPSAPVPGTHSSTEPAVLVLIATLLLLCSVFPGDQASAASALVVLGSSLPLLAALALAQRQQQQQLVASAEAWAAALAAQQQQEEQQRQEQQQQPTQQGSQKPSAGRGARSAAASQQQPSSPSNSSSSTATATTSSSCGAPGPQWSSAACPRCPSITEGLLQLLMALRALLARGAAALSSAAQQAAAAAYNGVKVPAAALGAAMGGSSRVKGGVLGLGAGLAKIKAGLLV